MSYSSNTRAVLFDLDGTLADTAADLTDTLNALLIKHGKNELKYESVRNHSSRGSIAMIELGFNESLSEKQINELREEFLNIYSTMYYNKTKLFPDVPELLDLLDNEEIPWGIVTNKPGKFTEPLIKKLDIAYRAICVVSGDSVSKSKPNPDPLHHAAKILGISESECIYMGDDPRDIQAGKAANMKTAVAAYGYIQEDDDPSTWGADVICNRALELKDWLFKSS